MGVDACAATRSQSVTRFAYGPNKAGTDNIVFGSVNPLTATVVVTTEQGSKVTAETFQTAGAPGLNLYAVKIPVGTAPAGFEQLDKSGAVVTPLNEVPPCAS